MCPGTSFGYKIKIIKDFNINVVSHVFYSNVHTVYSVLKSVWTCVCLVSIVNDLKTCSACLVTKATLLAWDLFQVCSRNKLLLWNHLTWWQNFFFKCNFSYFPKSYLSHKGQGFSWQWTSKRTHHEFSRHLPSGILQDAMHFTRLISPSRDWCKIHPTTCKCNFFCVKEI